MNYDNTYKQTEGQKSTDTTRFLEGLVKIYSYSYS